MIAGTLVSAVGLGTASVLSDGPVAAPPEATVLDTPVGSEFSRPRDDTEAELPQVSDQPHAPVAPQVAAPVPDDLAAVTSEMMQSAAQPDAGQAEGTLSAPQTSATSSGVTVESDSPVLPSPQAAPPAPPVSEDDLSISTDPAQPALPDVTQESGFPQNDLAAIAVAPPEPAASSEPSVPADAPEVEAPEVDTPEVEASEPAPDIAPGIAPDIASDIAPDIAPEPAIETDDQADGSSTIGNLASDVTTNRLPSVGDAAAPDPAPQAESMEEEAQEDQRALIRHAAEFENPEDKPLMSIILIDDGSGPVGLQALESFPYPISFAVDNGWDGAEDAMATYRAAGFEVLAMVDLPEGAGAQDAEVTMQAVFDRVPEAVAVIEGAGTGLQSSRSAAGQLAPILLESGHGAVFFPKGLNTAQQLLAREGVPAVSVFRDFDAKGQSATVIRRFLDQAAFKAAQEDAGVVMVGRLRPDTVSALLLWGLQDRAERVALAPISALLRGE